MSQLKLYKSKLWLYLIWFFLTTLFYHAFSSFFWIIDLYFLILAVIVQTFVFTAELAIPTKIRTSEDIGETDRSTATNNRNKMKKMFKVI